ncbi:glutaredoxin family protein [Rubrivirga sp. IMCC45206]|uniref:glutaredoxin family protein n=1 Tax=Rubrivirga sp. IMCC45206 TaxID=3391614 RepID=UPI00398FDA0C
MRFALFALLFVVAVGGCRLESRPPMDAAQAAEAGVPPGALPEMPPPPGTQPPPPPAALTNPATVDGKAEVVLYVTEWCPYCAQAREYMADNDVPHRVVDIEKDPEGQREYAARGGTGGIPLVAVGLRAMEGWNAEVAQGMLDDAGY